MIVRGSGLTCTECWLYIVFTEHFPKPYTKAEKKMLAKEDQQIEETSDSEDAEDE